MQNGCGLPLFFYVARYNYGYATAVCKKFGAFVEERVAVKAVVVSCQCAWTVVALHAVYKVGWVAYDGVETLVCGKINNVGSVTFKGLNYDIIVDFRGFKWLIQTTDFHGVGTTIGIRLNPEDIHIMHKSEYSGMFGDYSSYSAEYDELTEDAEDEEE